MSLIKPVDDLEENFCNSLKSLDLGPSFDLSIINHVGFEMDHIINKIRANAVKARRTESELTVDMFHCVVVGLLKGNIRIDQIHRITNSSSDRIHELIRIYEIPVRKNSKHRISSSSDTLTFVRSITCFPRLASNILRSFPNLVTDFRGSTMRTSELPACMKHSGFAGLIPRNCNDLVKFVLESAHIAYMIDFGRIINPRGFESVMKSYKKQGKISEMAMRNSHPADDERVAYLWSVGMFDVATFKTVVSVANELMREINGDRICEDDVDAALLYVFLTREKEVSPPPSLVNQSSDLDSLFYCFHSSDLVSLLTAYGSSSPPCRADVGAIAKEDVIPSTSSGATSSSSLPMNQNGDLLSLLLKFGL